MLEIWKDVKGYEGLYQVSNTGKVRSLNYKRLGVIRELKPFVDKYGYLIVNLSSDGKYKSKKIHRLVAEAFIPNPLNLEQVNHKDECKTNNCVDNLEWCDAKYNANYGTRNNRLEKPILQLFYDGTYKIWSSAKEASNILGIDGSSITKVCKGKHKTAGGYNWRYK